MEKTKKFLCCVYAVLRKGVRNMIQAAKASLSGEPARPKRKSPIQYLLKSPGRSLRWEGYWRLGVTVAVFMAAVMFLFLSFQQWIWTPWSLLLAGLHFLVLWVILHFAWRDEIENYFLGDKGERAVAYVLDRLGRPKWRVFHDFEIPGESGNIDHIVVCPKGVFCIETKALRKDSDETRNLRFDGEQILRGDFPLPQNPLLRAKYRAKKLRDLLQDNGVTSINFVKPVIIYPGWKFAEDSVKSDDVIVGNRKALKSLEGEGDFNDDGFKQVVDFLESKNKVPLDD